MKKMALIAPFVIVTTVLLLSIFLTGCPDEGTITPENRIKFASNHEFVTEKNGLQAFQETYDFQFDEVYEMAIGLTHEALGSGDVEVAKGYATDGKIIELELIKLKDDKEFFPRNHPAPVAREEILDTYPEIKKIMTKISAALDTDTMMYLNYLVDIEEYGHREVAQHWLLKEGLISETLQRPIGIKPIIIGSKNFTEQQILGQIAILALENAGIPIKDFTNMGDTKVIRSAIIESKIDMYWEYTLIVWDAICEEEKMIAENIISPEKIYQAVTEIDMEKALIWLDYAPLNNYYAIIMRKEHAEELEITTISELAEWVKQVQAGILTK